MLSKNGASFWSRRLTAPDGSFAGILTTSFDLPQVQNLFQKIELGVDSGIALIDFDGVIYSRTSSDPSQASLIGQRFPRAGVLRHAAQAPVGVYWSQPGTLDDVKRLVSYRVVEGFPFIAAVGISQAAVFNQWNAISASIWELRGF